MSDDLYSLKTELINLVDQLPNHKYAKWIERSLLTILKMADQDFERLNWKILTSALDDMATGFDIFHPYRHVRKVTVFGSARISSASAEYQMAKDFSHRITELGYMVMTGAGGGIMEAGNEGATAEKSFGLNIKLPFEQYANPVIHNDPKLITFKYFFTRKLFMLKESDAIALFPGGFGTQDEAMECITLCQTGRYGPVPLVLIDPPGGSYWRDWEKYIQKHLFATGLVSKNDHHLYRITDNIDTACEHINNFYRVYHSSRYVKEKFVIRLKSELDDECVQQLNDTFKDILIDGQIEKSAALPQETGDPTFDLPRLVLHFNQRDLGRLYELIAMINSLSCPFPEQEHPEIK